MQLFSIIEMGVGWCYSNFSRETIKTTPDLTPKSQESHHALFSLTEMGGGGGGGQISNFRLY